MAKIADLVVVLRANSAKFTSAVEKADRRSKKFGRDMNQTFRRIAKVTAASAAAAGASIAFFTKQAIDSADQAIKTADKLGLTVEALQKLRFAADLTGVETQKLELGIQRMTRRIAEAAQGTGEAQGALKTLGLEASELVRLSPDEMFKRVAEAMGGVENRSERLRLAFKLFDSEGVDLVRTLALGREGLERTGQEAEDLGAVIDTKTARAAERFNDQLTRIGQVGTGVFARFAAASLPVLEDLLDAMVPIARQLGVILDRFRRLDTLSTRALNQQLVDTRQRIVDLQFELQKTQELQNKFGLTSATTGFGSQDFEARLEALKDRERRIRELLASRGDEPEGGGPPILPPVTNQNELEERNRKLQEAIERQRELFQQRQEAAEKSVESVVAALRTEEEAIEAAADRRLEIIENALNLEVIQEERAAELRKGIRAQEMQELRELRERQIEEDERAQERMIEERVRSFGQFRNIARGFLQAEQQTGEERVQLATDIGSRLADTLGTQSKKAFRVQKSLALAEATIQGFLAIQKALAQGGPIAGPAMAAAIGALTSANVAQIRAQRFTGRQFGGPVESNSAFRVGEGNKPELLLIPGDKGQVFSNAEAKRIGGGDTNVVVNIHGAPGRPDVQERRGEDGSLQLDIILERVDAAQARGIERGDSKTSRSMQRVFGVSRAAGAR